MTEETRSDPLADVINMLAAPIAGGIRSFEQFRRGVEELFRAVDNVNRTMENLNEAAMRINALLADIEQPVKALMPQVTRTVKAADEITSLMEGPVRATAPKIERIVDTLGSPGFMTLPSQVGELMQRMGPLAQLAENAGGLFGAFRMPGMTKPAAPPATAARARPAPERASSHPAVRAVKEVQRASTKKVTANKPAKPTPAKKRVTKTAPRGATPAN
jgi:hypothetical protein